MSAPPVVVLMREPEGIEEMAKEVVSKSPVKFCRVEEPLARRFPTVTKFWKTGVPPQVPERLPPFVALKVPAMVVEPVERKLVEVAPPESERSMQEIRPALFMLKSVEVAEAVEEPMA